MPRVYKHVTNREELLLMFSKDTDNGCSIRKSTKKYDCNRMTLKGFFDKRTTNTRGNFGYKAISTCHTVLSAKMRSKLAGYMKSLADRFHS